MTIRICHFDRQDYSKWDQFVEEADGGTIFHRLDFLNYHCDRFAGKEHHLAWYKGETLFGIMPMAVFDEQQQRIARSPYGASYGGPVFKKPLTYSESCEVVETLVDFLNKQGITSCILTLPISCCYKKYSETFRLTLIEHGFSCKNRDISSVTWLASDVPVQDLMEKRARNMARKAQRIGVEIVHLGNLNDFWHILNKTYEKIGTQPTHTLEELQWLSKNLPERVYVDIGLIGGKPVAGICFFVINHLVNSSFYLCQDPEFQDNQALSLLIYQALIRCQQNGYRSFDFGTSSTKMKGKPNLFQFKESFGSVGLFRDTYMWEAE
jgi:hypothetical protein